MFFELPLLACVGSGGRLWPRGRTQSFGCITLGSRGCGLGPVL